MAAVGNFVTFSWCLDVRQTKVKTEIILRTLKIKRKIISVFTFMAQLCTTSRARLFLLFIIIDDCAFKPLNAGVKKKKKTKKKKKRRRRRRRKVNYWIFFFEGSCLVKVHTE